MSSSIDNVAKIQFLYPVELDSSNNTLVVEHETLGEATLTFPEQVYMPFAFGDFETIPDKLIELVNDEFSEDFDVSIDFAFGRVQYQGGGATGDVDLLFDDEDTTLAPETLGFKADSTEDTLNAGSSFSTPHTRVGIWEVPVLKYQSFGGYDQNVPAYGLLDWRSYDIQTIYSAYEGANSTQSAFERQLSTEIVAFNLPAVLIHKDRTWDTDALDDFYGGTLSTREGNEVNTLEYWWEKAPYWGDVASGECNYLRIEFEDGDVYRVPARWPEDLLERSYTDLIDDEPSSKERYRVNLVLHTYRGEEE